MAIEIRTARDDERESLHKLSQMAFASTARPYDDQADRESGPLEHRLVAVDPDAPRGTGADDGTTGPRGRLVGLFRVWELGQWFGGRRVPAGGVSAVSVHPAYRNRGVGSRLAAAALPAMHERGETLATLYPLNHTFYRRFGWELAGGHPLQEINARALLDLPKPAVRHTLRPTRPDDLPELRRLHDACVRTDPGNLSYGPEFATRRLLGHEGFHEGYVVQSGSALTGLVTLAHTGKRDDGEFYSLDVRNLFAADLDSELALWQLIAGHYPVARTVRFTLAQHETVPTLLGERGARPAGAGWCWMTRLVDAAAAVAARGYAPEGEAEIALDVVDDTAPWNAGPHVLRVRDGAGVLEPGGPGTVRVDIGTLASLYTGWANPHTLARLGRLPGAGDADVTAFDRVFRGRTPWMRDFF